MLSSAWMSAFIVFSVFVTAIMSGILGMAGGMVLMGILVWLLPVQQAMILHAIAQFFSNASRAFIHRAHIYTQTLPLYFAGMAAVLGIFTFVTFVPEKWVVYLLLGLGPFLAAAMPKKMQLDFTRPAHAFGCGMLVTVFQLTGGVSGSMLDIFFQTRKMTRHQNVATKALTQSASHAVKFVYFGFLVSSLGDAAAGLPLWLCLAVIPTALLGSHTSKRFLHRLSDAQFYKITQAILFVIGVVYICRAGQLALIAG